MLQTVTRASRFTSRSVISTMFLMSAPIWAQPAFIPGEGFRPAAMSIKDPREAVISTIITVTNATGNIGASGVSLSGNASLTNIGSGSLTGSIPLTPSASGNLVGTFVITLAGSGDKINGTLTVPVSALSGGALTGSAAITGGTGAYAGATGSFPTLTGTLSVGLSVSLTFSGAGTITTGGGGTTGGGTSPVITDVLDAASNTKDIAQGSIFIIKGSNLSAAGFTQMGFPLPTSAGGVTIKFAPPGAGASGQGTSAFLVYLYNQGGVNQLAAVVPSTLATGTYDVAVTYNGATGVSSGVKVVQRKPAFLTADSTGGGLTVVQNYVSAVQLDIDRLTTFSSGGFTFSPAKPGQTLIAWATGFGPVPSADNAASPGYDFSANGVNVQVIVGGVTIKPLYAGRAPGLAGADQINFTLPADIPTGCTVSFQVSMNGVLSPTTFIAIAPNSSATACVQPGFTTSQLQQYDNGASYTLGYFSLSQFSTTISGQGTVKIDAASGQFVRYTGAQLLGLTQAQAQFTAANSCYVTHVVSSTQTNALAITATGLDAGNVTLNGPSGSGITNRAFTQDSKSNSYSINLGFEGGGFTIPGSTPATLVSGTYSVAGAGGKDVGKFNANVNLGAPLNITGGLPATVVRSNGLPLSWTGGNPSDLVIITGTSTTTTGSGVNQIFDSWSFVCSTTAGAQSFTVPASILTQLPAASGTNGSLGVLSGVSSTFTAPLTAGGNIDSGSFTSFVGTLGTPSYQ